MDQFHASGILTPSIVRQAFGIDPVSRTQAFFVLAEEWERIVRGGGIRFETMLRNGDDTIVLAIFVFHGWRIVYAFPGAPAVRGAFVGKLASELRLERACTLLLDRLPRREQLDHREERIRKQSVTAMMLGSRWTVVPVPDAVCPCCVSASAPAMTASAL